MPKFKRGDEVRVKPNLNIEELRNVSPCFVSSMDITLGETGKIIYVNVVNRVQIRFNDPTISCYYSFNEKWIEHVVVNNEVVIVEEE